MSTQAHQASQPADPACDDTFDLLGAYALDALDPDEQRTVAAHLTQCPRCRAELDRMQGVVSLLGRAAQPSAPPPALRSRLLDEIRLVAPASAERAIADPDRVLPAPVPLPRHPRGVILSRWAAGGLALVASILVLAVVGAGVLLHRAQGERDLAQQGQHEVAEYLRNGGVVAALVPAPGAGHALGEGSGSLIVAPNQPKALLVVYGMPTPSPSQHYQVWVERAGQRTAVADLNVDADGAGWLIVSMPKPLVNYDLVGVAVTRKGGPPADLLTVRIPHGQTA